MNMRSIYRKIAKEQGITVEEVKRQMQAAIDDAYLKSNKAEGVSHFQKSIPYQGQIPTTEEFIASIADKILLQKKGNKPQ